MRPDSAVWQRVLVHAADQSEPIPLAVTLRSVACGSRSFEVPSYEHAEAGPRSGAPTVLCLAGGGSSGAVFARLVERAAARGVRAVAFDFPGHTPESLLGERTPPRSLLRHATPRVRARITAALVRELAERVRGGSIQLVAHSAGLLDAAALAGEPARAWRASRCSAPACPASE